jgi:hypothetical protein
MVRFQAQDKFKDMDLIAELPIYPEADIERPPADEVERPPVDEVIQEHISHLNIA